jgi:LysM repeat protein
MKIKLFVCISFLVSLYSAVAYPTDSLKTITKEGIQYVLHEVEEKETLFSLSRRYGSNVESIVRQNKIVHNRIEIGEIVWIPIDTVSFESMPIGPTTEDVSYHIVKEGETLYSLSKKYEVTVDQLTDWNQLSSYNLDLGMRLRVSDSTGYEYEDENDLSNPPSDTLSAEIKDPFADFEVHLVQIGETLTSIADELMISIDSIKSWNELNSDFISIGQKLYFKEELDSPNSTDSIQDNRLSIDEKGFKKVFKEGIASVIKDMKTTRYLALHKSLPMGTELEVRNLMNNRVVHVKIVGRLPDTGVNKNLLLRISQPAYDQLGILDKRSRVEISYYPE